MLRNKDFAGELKEPLIDESEQHVIDVETESPSEFKIVKPAIPHIFPNRHFEAYFLLFLDFKSLANYTFINKETFQNVFSHALSPQVGMQRAKFMKSLRSIAYFEEDKALVDDCKVSMKAETTETFVTKAKRHLTWTVPYVGGEVAMVGSFIYKCVERSGVKDALFESKEALRHTINNMGHAITHSDLGEFFGYEYRNCYWSETFRHEVCSLGWRSTKYCSDQSWPWKSCQQKMTELCKTATASCQTYAEKEDGYDSNWWQAAGWGLGTIGAVAVGVAAGCIIGCKWDTIQDLYNPMNKPFYRLSRKTIDQIYTLNIDLKLTDPAKRIIQKLNQKKVELNRPNIKTSFADYARFVLFRETLPSQSKVPKEEKDARKVCNSF